jgi:ATP/maltotriose-dependent transcriptional regulator MalT
MATGQLDDALSALTEALDAAEENENRFYEAEAHRLKGELLLKRYAEATGADQAGAATRRAQRSRRRPDKVSSLSSASRIVDSNTAQAQSCFERAIEVAREQSAKSFELRATMSLARLLAAQGHPDQARTMLADIYNWFTEGFDTADLIDAKSLLDELGCVT